MRCRDLNSIDMEKLERIDIGDIKSEHIGRSVVVECIVRETDKPELLLSVGAFECQRCGSTSDVKQDGNKLEKPLMCYECEKKGPFKFLKDESTFIDTQKIRVEDDRCAGRTRGQDPW